MVIWTVDFIDIYESFELYRQILFEPSPHMVRFKKKCSNAYKKK